MAPEALAVAKEALPVGALHLGQLACAHGVVLAVELAMELVVLGEVEEAVARRVEKLVRHNAEGFGRTAAVFEYLRARLDV